MYQTPPPAGVVYAGHLFGVQFGASAIDVVLPPATYALSFAIRLPALGARKDSGHAPKLF